MKQIHNLLSKLNIFKKSDDESPANISRLRRKLHLYFILIAIVSVSVSLEIIIEVSSNSIQSRVAQNITEHYKSSVDTSSASKIDAASQNLNYQDVFWPIYNLRNRMLLLLLLITGSIIAAFVMFTKDIVEPMDNIVKATKRLADGDLTVKIPVMSEDEIGQVASLINDMNAKLLDMINQLKQDVSRHKESINNIAARMIELIPSDKGDEIVDGKKMRLTDFKALLKNISDCTNLLEEMSIDFSSLETFINMYKTYQMSKDISDSEILEALEEYNNAKS